MSSTRCEAFHWTTPIFVVSVIISLYIPFLERPLLYLLCIFITGAHWHYGTRVVSIHLKKNEFNLSTSISNISNSIITLFMYFSGATNV